MFKEILNTIWAWFWSKTEVDEKATETVNKIKVNKSTKFTTYYEIII